MAEDRHREAVSPTEENKVGECEGGMEGGRDGDKDLGIGVTVSAEMKM